MKKYIANLLVLAVLFQIACPVGAFSKDELFKLKPLLSERVTTSPVNFDDWKIWPAIGFGVLGLAVISANSVQPIDSLKLSNMVTGLAFITLGGLMALMPSDYKVNDAVIKDMKLEGVDKELFAYGIMKKEAKISESSRFGKAICLSIFGIGYAAAINSSNDYSKDAKSTTMGAALGFSAIMLYNMFFPAPIEKEVTEIDKSLGTN